MALILIHPKIFNEQLCLLFKALKSKNWAGYFCRTDNHLDPSQTRGAKWKPEFLHSYMPALPPHYALPEMTC